MWIRIMGRGKGSQKDFKLGTSNEWKLFSSTTFQWKKVDHENDGLDTPRNGFLSILQSCSIWQETPYLFKSLNEAKMFENILSPAAMKDRESYSLKPRMYR